MVSKSPSGRFVGAIGLLLCAAAPALADPALWHISDANSDIYIFGTVHILPAELDWRTEEIEHAFDRADTVWFEAPANDPAAGLQMMMLVQRLGLNPAGAPLSSQISASARRSLEAIAAETGLAMAGLEPLRPWLAAITLTAAYIQAQGYDPDSGVEARLWPLANESGKQLRYFETLEQQLRFFADLPREIELELFEQTVGEFEGASDQLDALVAAWESGDIDAIDRLVNGEMRASAPEVYDVVITQRNASWVETIRGLLEGSGSHFIALGAGHLAGTEGVVERLRDQGIDVTGP
jgi:hypothetical protein